MAKIKSESAGEMYDRILRSKGLPGLGEHLVLGFEFEREELMYCFHYALMDSGADVAIFDGSGRRAVVVARPADNLKIRVAAEECGGKLYDVNLKTK